MPNPDPRIAVLTTWMLDQTTIEREDIPGEAWSLLAALDAASVPGDAVPAESPVTRAEFEKIVATLRAIWLAGTWPPQGDAEIQDHINNLSDSTWHLSARDSTAFIDALLNPPEPNEALKALAARHKAQTAPDAEIPPVAHPRFGVPQAHPVGIVADPDDPPVTRAEFAALQAEVRQQETALRWHREALWAIADWHRGNRAKSLPTVLAGLIGVDTRKPGEVG